MIKKTIIFISLIFLVPSCDIDGKRFSTSCKDYFPVKNNKTCKVLFTLDHLNIERKIRKQRQVSCKREPIAYPGLANTFEEAEDNPAWQRDHSLQSLKPTKESDNSYLGQGYCNKVYLVKSTSNSLHALKVSKGTCQDHTREPHIFEITCALTNNPIRASILTDKILLTSYVQGKTLHKHLINGDFFSNKDDMKDKMVRAINGFLDQSVLYTDISSTNIIFEQSNKEWVFIDMHYPLLFQSPAEAKEHLLMKTWENKDYSEELNLQIKEFFQSL